VSSYRGVVPLAWINRIRRWPPARVDLVLAALVALGTVAGAVAGATRSGSPQLTAGGALLLIVSGAVTAARRRVPLAVLFVSGGAALWYGIARQPDPPLQLGMLLALYTVGARCSRRVIAFAVIVTLIAGGASIVFSHDATADSLYAPLLSSLLAVALGDRSRVHAAYVAAMEERAARVEREREQQTARAAADERTRIARELHDVVAHHVSLMVIQAEGGAAGCERDGTDPAAFDRIAAAGRAALVELRRVLGVLRQDDDDVSGPAPPQPGLAGIDALARGVTAAGVAVELRHEGTPRPLPSGVELSAYRIVQEALTNVVRHAGGAAAIVVVRFETDALTVEVIDAGCGTPLTPATVGVGRGLVGVRERVQVLGGSLVAGPLAEGGFRVAARLPLEG
jgi:signal transduction histidine kinase